MKTTILDQIIKVCAKSCDGAYLFPERNVADVANKEEDTHAYINQWLVQTEKKVITRFYDVFKGNEMNFKTSITQISHGLCNECDKQLDRQFLNGSTWTDFDTEAPYRSMAKSVMSLGLWSCVSVDCCSNIIRFLLTVSSPVATQKPQPTTDALVWRWVICMTKCVEVNLLKSGEAICKSTGNEKHKIICQSCLVTETLRNTLRIFSLLGINPKETFSAVRGVEQHLTCVLDPQTDIIHFISMSYIFYAFSYNVQDKKEFSQRRYFHGSLLKITSDLSLFHSVGDLGYFLSHFRQLNNMGKHYVQMLAKKNVSDNDVGSDDVSGSWEWEACQKENEAVNPFEGYAEIVKNDLQNKCVAKSEENDEKRKFTAGESKLAAEKKCKIGTEQANVAAKQAAKQATKQYVEGMVQTVDLDRDNSYHLLVILAKGGKLPGSDD